MPYFTVRYYAGSYSGYRTVRAEDEEDAIAQVKSSIRKDMTLPIYSDNYKIVPEESQYDAEEND